MEAGFHYLTGTVETGYTVTNTANYSHKDLSKDIEVTKIWEDDSNASSKRPSSITIELDGKAQGDRTDCAVRSDRRRLGDQRR